jgi:hypothetical protein
MALLGFAGVLALWAIANTVLAIRFRQGRAEHLRRRTYSQSLWPAARRSLPYGLFPISGILLVTSLSMIAQVAGLRGTLISAGYLLVMLALGVTMVVFMVSKPSWLAPPGPVREFPDTIGPDEEPIELPPRPIREMSGKELADWARGDPQKLERLLRRLRRERYGP